MPRQTPHAGGGREGPRHDRAVDNKGVGKLATWPQQGSSTGYDGPYCDVQRHGARRGLTWQLFM